MWAGLAVVLLAVVLPAVPASAASAKALPTAPVSAPAPAPAAFSDGGGPACGPGAPDRGGLPAVPARAQGEHGQVPAGRPVPEEARPHGAMPVRILVRGPDRPAPGPLELSVMRV